MRTTRTTTISILALCLLAGSVVGAAAQEEEVASEGTSVTGTATWLRAVSEGDRSTLDGLDIISDVVHAHRWTASDPRLSGDVTYTGNWHSTPAAGGIGVQSATYEVTNADGSWLGEASAVVSESLGADMDTIILAGRDAYEGMTAYVLLDWSGSDTDNFSGVIFPGPMPAVPEPHAGE